MTGGVSPLLPGKTCGFIENFRIGENEKQSQRMSAQVLVCLLVNLLQVPAGGTNVLWDVTKIHSIRLSMFHCLSFTLRQGL